MNKSWKRVSLNSRAILILDWMGVLCLSRDVVCLLRSYLSSRGALRWWLTLPSTVCVTNSAKNRPHWNVTGILENGVRVCVCERVCVFHYCVPAVDFDGWLRCLSSTLILFLLWLVGLHLCFSDWYDMPLSQALCAVYCILSQLLCMYVHVCKHWFTCKF